MRNIFFSKQGHKILKYTINTLFDIKTNSAVKVQMIFTQEFYDSFNDFDASFTDHGELATIHETCFKKMVEQLNMATEKIVSA